MKAKDKGHEFSEAVKFTQVIEKGTDLGINDIRLESDNQCCLPLTRVIVSSSAR